MRPALILALMLILPLPALAQALIADISDSLIAIRTDFTGEEVVLFGSTDGPGDVVLVISGPTADVTVRRKESIGGIWVNTRSVTFSDVPGYYAVAASRPLADIASEAALTRYEIGVERLDPLPDQPLEDAELDDFRSALIRRKAESGLFAQHPLEAYFLGERLFRTTFEFPAHVPTGLYNVEVYLFRDQALVDAVTTPLVISKVGFSANVFELSAVNAPIYALIALLGAIGAGWFAGFLFRRV